MDRGADDPPGEGRPGAVGLIAVAEKTSGWGRVERETPKQTSDRIVKQMQRNAKATQKNSKKV